MREREMSDRPIRSSRKRSVASVTHQAFLLMLLSLFTGAALSWPGVGIISIYFYRPAWTGLITVQYIGSGLDDAVNVTMLPYPGPDSSFQAAGWHYVEIGSNNISVLEFINASGFVDPPRHTGDYYSFDMAGEFSIVNGTVNQVQVYEPGCPGYPPDSAEFQCYSNGHCQFLAGICECDPGWGCPACECLLSCNSTSGLLANAAPKSKIQLFTQVATSGHCCGLCGQHVGCAAANFFYTNFSCVLLTDWDNVTPSDPQMPSIFVQLPSATVPPSTAVPTASPGTGSPGTKVPASPPSSDGSSFLAQHQWTLIAAGGGVVLLLALGGLFVRLITGGPPREGFALLDPADYSGTGASKLCDGKYKTIRILGRGAFGVVYLVTNRAVSPRIKKQTGLDSPQDLASPTSPDANFLAMKVIHCTSDDEMMTAFTEFKSLNALQGHEGIVPVVDMFMSWEVGHAKTPSNLGGVGVEGSLLPHGAEQTFDEQQGEAAEDDAGEYNPVSRYLCIVMEYFPEGTLDRAVVEHEEHFHNPQVVLSIFRQILSAMAHSHKKNIIHRDLKPGNVLLANGATRIVLSDFGLAQDLENTSTQAGGGTLHYLAPEQIDHKVSRKSDVWSIACIIVAVATGHCGPKVRALFMMRSLPSFESDLRQELCDLPSWTCDLLLAMLASLPLERPSVEECLAVFDAAVRRTNATVDPPSLLGLASGALHRPPSSRHLGSARQWSSQLLGRQGTNDSISDRSGSPSPRGDTAQHD
jgi:serine/threonine protein kinase